MKRVLIADDEESIRRSSSRLIKVIGLPNEVKIDSVDNGISLVELARKEKYDLILSDGSMPGLSGYQAIKEIRRESLNIKTPSYIVSSDDETSARVNANDSGATGFFHKIYDFNKLVDVLKEELSK